MFDGYTESPERIAARKARILATMPAPILPPLPTLEECLQMHEDHELVRQARSRQIWAEFMAEVEELKAEVMSR